ncbi:MAG: GrpB family protein [Rhodospirillales bacterium]|nr:GrpB family protein [Rhodospirillales bacterium]
MGEPIIIVPYNPGWPATFAEYGRALRGALGQQAVRLDHIGSTAVPGLAAKPIIDIQVSVRALEPMDAYQPALTAYGLQWRADNPDRTRRYFRELPGMPRTHLHVRRAGSWGEQFALLFRDYLRCHPEAAERYAQAKQHLAQLCHADRAGYVAAKEPIIWDIMHHADQWACTVGWEPPPSDW